jgi:hypothetical protein
MRIKNPQVGRNPKQRGPKPEILNIEGIGWEDAMKKALQKKRPDVGWPKPEKPKTSKS